MYLKYQNNSIMAPFTMKVVHYNLMKAGKHLWKCKDNACSIECLSYQRGNKLILKLTSSHLMNVSPFSKVSGTEIGFKSSL